ncbi:Prokaryotic-type class I peptide chain release factors domain-containing protein [[Candida] zeylanoides]
MIRRVVRHVRHYSLAAELPRLHPLLAKRAEALGVESARLESAMAGAYDHRVSAEFARVAGTLAEYRRYQEVNANVQALVELVNEPECDPDILQEAISELKECVPQLVACTQRLEARLMPPVAHADRPTLMELRPGVGGSEAQLFTTDLLAMYTGFAQHNRWKWHVVSSAENGAVLSVDEPGSYNVLRHESGVHRVQRVPATETKGRTHTSTAAVVVLPKLSEGNEQSLAEDERQFAPGEIRIDTMRSGGKGGQHVNTTDSAVRLTHIPTGIQVLQQDERSQPRNKAKAFSIMRSKLAALDREREIAQQKSLRTNQVTTTDRSDKIRTYNYSQNRVTDHRCGFSLHDIPGCLSGERLGEVIAAVEQEEVRHRLEDMAQ